ncbi:hypothetical protein B0H63DRAFT_193792 [Podospora didyma]|uniref:Uncharacterized protein n=1 Tax=Podospora didyma TaxID=330526 RepID=A0AAE0TV88_9PEZI|nr:hypothetical protein B0H63DRAFT_193792 [Podospora didyma]
MFSYFVASLAVCKDRCDQLAVNDGTGHRGTIPKIVFTIFLARLFLIATTPFVLFFILVSRSRVVLSRMASSSFTHGLGLLFAVLSSFKVLHPGPTTAHSVG